MSKKLSDLRVVLTSSVVSLADVSLNIIVGLITGSTVILSQALQGLSDLATSGLLLVGVMRSRKASDEKFQFGYGREIFFWVIMAGLLMFLGTGAASVYLGYQQFISPGVVNNVYLAIGLLLFGVATNGYALSLSVKRLQQNHPGASRRWQLRHSSIVETKTTLLVDFLGTAAAIFGLIALIALVITGDTRFDGVGSIVIGITMMVASIYLIRDVRSLIVGRSVDNALAQQIMQITKLVHGVNDVLDLRTMYLGSGQLLIIIEVHIEDNHDTDSIEKIIDTIKQNVSERIPEARHIQVEVETPDSEIAATKS